MVHHLASARPRHLRSLLATAIAALLFGSGAVMAQSADATLRGKAPPESDVTAKNVATGITRRAHVAADGNYTLSGLPPGTYRVDAGPGTEQTVTVSVASTATLDLGGAGEPVAEIEAPMEEITVRGRRLAEVRTSEIGATVSQQQIETVPQMTRNFLEFADTVPGIAFGVDNKGKTSIRSGAQSGNNVNVYIDGVGQKGYVRSGLSGQAGDTQGNPFPQLAIGEYKVITSNYKAEYDQLSSAAITALTRSGTNEFEVQAFGTYSFDNWRARTPRERVPGEEKAESETKEYGIAFGGPLIEDKLHFFLTYEAKRYATPITVVTSGGAPAEYSAALPANALDQLGARQIGFEEDLFFGKLDWQFTDSDHLQFSVKIRDEVSQGDQTGAGVAASAAIDTNNDDKRFELTWKHSGDGWFNELQGTYEDAFFVPHVAGGDNNGANYTWINGSNDASILLVDGSDPRAGQNKGQKGWAIANNITFSDIEWIGNHTVKAGVKYKRVELTAQDAVVNNPVFSYNVTPAGTAEVPWRAIFGLPVSDFSPIVTSQTKQLGLFVQDDWELNDHLTLNLGVRYDIEWTPSYLDFQTPQFLVDAFNQEVSPGVTYGQSLGLSQDPNTRLDINDYISTGNNRDPYKGAIQPRLGFSYDLGGDQQHVIFGGAGRAYDRNLYDRLQLEQTKFALAQAEVRFNTVDHPCIVTGTGCVNWDPAYANDISALHALLSGTAGEVNLINNDLKVPYSDQFSVGMRNRFGDWQTSASISRIVSKDGFVFTLGHRRADGSFWQGRSQPWNDRPPGLVGNMLVGNNGVETKSTQVLLSASKPFDEASRWGATFSYTFTKATTNRDVNELYSFDQVSIREYQWIDSNAAPKHRFVGTGSYAAPWDITVAGKLTWATSTPHAVVSCLDGTATFPNGAPCTAFAYEVSGTGYKALDLQVTKNFDIRDYTSFYLRLDFLNVTNEDNLVDFTDFRGSNGLVTGGSYNRDGNTTGFPRTLRASFGVKF
jgi:outer membrane receptor protein involved in Fe transport